MPERTNHLDDLTTEVAEDIFHKRQEGEKEAKGVIPFGQQRVTPAEFWAQASAKPELLKQMLKEGRRDEIVKAIREGKLRKG